MRANANALLVAAQDKTNQEVDLSTEGKFELKAEVWTLEATVFSALHRWKFANEFSLSIEPHIYQIHDFQHTRGNLLLSNSDGSSQLVGQVMKIGTRHYGFLPEDRRDEGRGAGMHIRGSWLGPRGGWDVSIQNLWSQLRFGTVHRQNRQYNVAAQGNKLKISEYPSITGEYGIISAKEKLPMHWQVSLAPNMLAGTRLGLLGFGNEVRWTALYSIPVLGSSISIRTVQARNWTVGYTRSIGADWKFAMGISADAKLNGSALSTLSLIKSW
jgi:hypothetical protein